MVPTSTEGDHRNAATTRSGFVLVSTYAWMCVTIGVAMARFSQGLIVHKIEFGHDDATALVGTILYLGTTISWQYAVNGGLGKDSTNISAEDRTVLFKASYVATIISIWAMTFAKLSSAFLIERVAPQTHKARIVLFGMIAVWSVFSVFAVSFQCGLPHWTAQSLQCRNGVVMIVVIALNIVTDLGLAGWLMPTLWSLSMDNERCMTAAMLFGARALVPIVAGVQAWAAAKAATSNDPTRDAVELAVITQSVTSLSLIVASIPRIKRFLGVGGSGMLYPQIQATELSVSRKSQSRQNSRVTEPKLVPSGSTNFTVTVSSKGAKEIRKTKPHSNWHGLVSMGTQEDEHTSTSSLFDRDEYEGVMMQREVRVSVEDNSIR